MRELYIQKWLRDPENHSEDGYPNLGKLQSEFGIYAKKSTKYPNLIQFHYDQIESSGEKVRACSYVLECRGLILDSTNNWSVVAYPFNRFFNSDEICASKIDWSSARVQEKVDGSLMILYYYNGTWNVATKGSPDAAGTVGTETFTFAELFWKFCPPTEALDPTVTYMVEMASNYNRVVCTYSLQSFYVNLTLIGARSIVTFDEIPIREIDCYVFSKVKEYSLKSIDDVIEAAKALNPIQQEGFVVVDSNFNRVKVKSPSYVLIHHMKDSFSTRRMIDLIKIGETNEFLSYFPEYVELYESLTVKMDSLIKELENEYEVILQTMFTNETFTQKDFALLAVKSKVSGVLFAVKAGKYPNVRAAVLSLSTEKLESLLK